MFKTFFDKSYYKVLKPYKINIKINQRQGKAFFGHRQEIKGHTRGMLHQVISLIISNHRFLVTIFY
jgi:hypothetical protein